MEWIDINEKKPELWQNVLVAYGGMVMIASLYVAITNDDKTIFYFAGCDGGIIDADYWMPLPEYPQTKKIEQ